MKPNIITILVDDMGFSDVGCFGSEIETPHLDSLAQNGLRLSQFYNTARCCPARAALLTGLYPHEAGVGMMTYRDIGDGYLGRLNDKCVTYAEVLKEAGYQTMLSGKWHTGSEPDARPEVRGFDRFTGVYAHIDSYFAVLEGCEIYRDGKLMIPASKKPINPYNPEDEFYTTDFFTDVALDYIDQALEAPEKPFLLHTCYNAPHFPLEAPDHLLEKYRGSYKKGWDVMREEKLKRMKELGLVATDHVLPTVQAFDQKEVDGFDFKMSYDVGGLTKWDSLSPEEQDNLDFRRAMYAAQIDRMDENIGRIILHLKDKNIFDNTLILFMSDNGCSGELGEFGMNWPEYGPDNYRDWRTEGGWSISQGQCWASLSNSPLRKFKIFVHEGGISSPFIAHWPLGISNPGRLETQGVHHLIDVMPTLCEITGAPYPETFDGKDIKPVSGKSFAALFNDESSEVQSRTLYWQHETNAAIRRGNWKLVTSNDRDPDAWELYNLENDRAEVNDLSAEHKEMVAEFIADWEIWAAKADVVPYPEDRDNLRRIPWPPQPV